MAVTALAVALVIGVGSVALAGGPGWRGGINAGTSSTPVAGSLPDPGTASLLPLSDAEEEALIFMREEEKLAHDVYTTLYDIWNIKAFDNIAASESRHMESVKTLLDRYGVDDPVAADAGIGDFTDLELRTLYTQLVALGSQSRTEALKVGVTIEEKDIADLEQSLAATEHADIAQVLENLSSASENHLAAFSRLLTR